MNQTYEDDYQFQTKLTNNLNDYFQYLMDDEFNSQLADNLYQYWFDYEQGSLWINDYGYVTRDEFISEVENNLRDDLLDSISFQHAQQIRFLLHNSIPESIFTIDWSNQENPFNTSDIKTLFFDNQKQLSQKLSFFFDERFIDQYGDLPTNQAITKIINDLIAFGIDKKTIINDILPYQSKSQSHPR